MSDASKPELDENQGAPSLDDHGTASSVSSLKKELSKLQADHSWWQQKANKAEREARQLHHILLELRQQGSGQSPNTLNPQAPSQERRTDFFSSPAANTYEQMRPLQPWIQTAADRMSWNQYQQTQRPYHTQQFPWHSMQQTPAWNTRQQQLGSQQREQEWLQPGQTRAAPGSPKSKGSAGPPEDLKKVATEAALIACRQSLRDAENVDTLEAAIENAKSLGLTDGVTFGVTKLAKMRKSI